jgi:chemosensory pili system protein ChpA (sensor histidine kinase/response regulator)
LFNLAAYFPAEESSQDAGARTLLSTLRENLGVAKDHWIRYCAGRTESLQPFQQAALAVFEAAAHLPNTSMQSLTRIVQAVAKRLPGEADATHNEALQLEMATALLLAQNAAEHYAALGTEFAAQSNAQAMRLQAAIDPKFDTSKIPVVEMLDEISRAAQEKLVVAQVTQEIQANLNQVEEVLDRFFRDANDRAGMPMLPNLMKQILGALNILQLDVAADLVREAIKRIEHFTVPDAPGEANYITPENLNWVAEALSTLGVYLDALRHGRDDSQALAGLLAQPEIVVQPEATVESQIRADTDRIKENVQQWAEQGGDAEARESLKAELGQLARDADLVGDATLRGQADAAMKALSDADSAPPGELVAAVQSIGAAPLEAPPPSAEAMRLAAASDEDVDQEMLSTFIEEAQDVLGNIATQVARLNVSPYDNEAFTSVRRSFHTLKGSGRMVGLNNLAEPAWEVEQTLNVWLRDEKVPSSEMLDFLDNTANAFQVWVTELEEQGLARVEAAAVIDGARRLRGDKAAATEAPPPKSEAGDSAQSGPAAGETESVAQSSAPEQAAATTKRPRKPAKPSAEIVIDGHRLSAELYAIFTDEATQRLTELDASLNDMAGGQRPAAWEAFIRAAHTLAGISRTTGFMPLAEAAHEVELWASQWSDKTVPLSAEALAGVADALAPLNQAVTGILARRFPASMPQVAAALARTMPPAKVEPDVEPEAVAPLAEVVDAVAPPLEVAKPYSPSAEPVLDFTPEPAQPAPVTAHDELDEQLLPIFLEEAAELLPRVGGVLRQWRAAPEDIAARDALKRALHTLKGSARMAGAMVLGESVHAMETQVIESGDKAATTSYLDSLESAYDHLADLIEQLKPGQEQDEAETEAAPAAVAEGGESPRAASRSAPASIRRPSPRRRNPSRRGRMSKCMRGSRCA